MSDDSGLVPRLTRLQKQLVSNYESNQQKSPHPQQPTTDDDETRQVIKSPDVKPKFRAQRKFAESSLLSSGKPQLQVPGRKRGKPATPAATAHNKVANPKTKRAKKVSFYPPGRKTPQKAPKNIICSGTVDATTFADFLCYRGTEFEPKLP